MKKNVFLSFFIIFSPFFGENALKAQYEENEAAEIIETPAENSRVSIQDSLSFSSGYLESQYTNKQLAVFGLEIIRGMARLENFLSSCFDNEGRTVAKWGTRMVYMLFIHRAFNSAYHEIGHGLRVRAYGGDFELRKRGERNSFKKNENFFKFFIKKVGNFSRATCRYDKELNDKEQLVVAAAGMNNETYIAERISRDFHDRGSLEFAESFAYFYGKLSPVYYALSKSSENGKPDIKSGDDPVAVGGYYNKLGISASKNDIALGGLLSTLLSGTTYSVIKSAFSANGCATPLSFYNFQVPDTFSYVTSQGVSYKVVSAYKYKDDLKITFGAEHVFHGKSKTEVNVGFNKAFGGFHDVNIGVAATFGNGFCLEASCSIPLISSLYLNIDAGTYSCKSILGERHSKNMKDGKERSSDISVSISYRY